MLARAWALLLLLAPPTAVPHPRPWRCPHPLPRRAGAAPVSPPPAPIDTLAARFPNAQLDDKTLCDRLLARTAADAAFVDPEPRARRKVIVSDLHLGPGTGDLRFTGLEDFYAHADWTAFLERQAAAGPTDLIINGDFIEFWQIAAALGALPKRSDPKQPATGVGAGGGPELRRHRDRSSCSPRTARCSPTSASCSTAATTASSSSPATTTPTCCGRRSSSRSPARSSRATRRA